MTGGKMIERYSRMQARVHDTLIARRALNLHEHIVEQAGLEAVLAEPVERSVLDVGCGGGQAAIRLQERYPHLRLTGIDLSDVMIERARNRARAIGSAAQFLVADAQSLPFTEASFDVVFSFGSAKHWPDPLEGLGECWRVLKPDGELLVADATSDATLNEVEKFVDFAHLPAILRKPAAALLRRRLFQLARPVESYRRVADRLGMPDGSLSHMPSLPVFLCRTRKPAA